MLCLVTLSPWRSSTGLGTSEAYSDSWRCPGRLVSCDAGGGGEDLEADCAEEEDVEDEAEAEDVDGVVV